MPHEPDLTAANYRRIKHGWLRGGPVAHKARGCWYPCLLHIDGLGFIAESAARLLGLGWESCAGE